MPNILSSLRKRIPKGRGELKRPLQIAGILIGVLAFTVILFRFSPYLEQFAKYGYLGVFLATFVASTSIIFPVPGVIVMMAAAAIWNPALVAVAGSVGGTLGEITAYGVGYWGRVTITKEYSGEYKRAEDWMNRYGAVAVFLFALIPVLVFDLVGIAAGALRFPFWRFLLACWAGRLPRSFIECYIGWGVIPLISPFLFG